MQYENGFTNQWTKTQIIEFRKMFSSFGLEVKDDNFYYFEIAFTHQSYAHDNNLGYNYEKLEFYGDALLEKEISTYLFEKKNLSEKEMTKARIKMVKQSTLAQIAKDLHFENFILSNTDLVKKIYEDVFEAFCAAIYLTLGEESLRSFIHQTNIYYFEKNLIKDEDYKSELQEILQNIGKKPTYDTILEIKNGNDHIFEVEVRWDKLVYGVGRGSTKKDAEKEAAKDALEKMVWDEKQ